MSEKKDINIDSTNIFDEFTGDKKIKEELKTLKEEKVKDIYYYMGLVNNFIGGFNGIAVLSFILLFGYIYVQNDDTMDDLSSLKPVCSIFVNKLGENDNCASVSSLLKKYKNSNENIKKEYFEENLPLIKEIYQNSNFVSSKEATFLLKNSKNRLKVLEILSEFDKMKNDFEPINKSRIICEGITISSDFVLEMKCTAFSGEWDSKKIGKSGKNIDYTNINGTSISIASSFINFIESIEDPKFYLLEKQKKFNFVDILDNNGYTKKTTFNLKLMYKNNNISLQKK